MSTLIAARERVVCSRQFNSKLFVILSAVLLPMVLTALAARYGAGPLTQHMVLHIAVMNGSALLLAIILPMSSDRSFCSGLAAATIGQILFLYLWHAPPVFSLVTTSRISHALMLMSLAAISVWFWREVFSVKGTTRWRAVASILITGKFFCLLGALIIFSPRVLFDCSSSAVCSGAVSISDQHLAGLLMVAVCPLTYVLAGTIIAHKWLSEMSGYLQHQSGKERETQAPRLGR